MQQIKPNSQPSAQAALLETLSNLHGGFWRYQFLDFAYLYNPYFPPPGLWRKLKSRLPDLITQYPSAQKELAALAANWTGIDARFLTVSNGASEAIRILNDHYIQKIAVPVPSFNEYTEGLPKDKVCYFPLDQETFVLNLKDYAEFIKKHHCRAAVVVNPNNPTSLAITKADLLEFLRQLAGLDLIIIDESFIDFVSSADNSLKAEFQSYPNLLIIHSMSKEGGFLGARLGYTVSAHLEANQILRRHYPIWNVNSIAEFILENMPDYRGDYDRALGKIIKDREYLYKKLSKLSFLEPFPPAANFVFARLKGALTAPQVKRELFVNHNMMIKDCGNKQGLEGGKYIRLGVCGRKDTDLLINALSLVCGA